MPFSRLLTALLFSAASSGCVVFEEPIRTDAGQRDGGSDAGPRDASTGDAGVRDAGTDGGPSDAGPFDAGPFDAGPFDAGPPSCVVASIPTFDDCRGNVVINEVDGSGEDFIEIYNRGTSQVNVSNWIIADDNAGTPDINEGAIIPIGTMLPPGGFLYVWANLGAPQPGLRTTDCIPGAPPPCLHSAWGISGSGERVYLLDDALTVVCTFQLPAAIFPAESFGRIGDGSAQLCPNDPTPGEVNEPSSMR
jgi:hypothetical protein